MHQQLKVKSHVIFSESLAKIWQEHKVFVVKFLFHYSVFWLVKSYTNHFRFFFQCSLFSVLPHVLAVVACLSGLISFFLPIGMSCVLVQSRWRINFTSDHSIEISHQECWHWDRPIFIWNRKHSRFIEKFILQPNKKL
jgi:hypothetical protein